MKKQNTISGHLIQFCRFLRESGFILGPQEESISLQALTIIPYNHPEIFKNALRGTLVKSKSQLDQFDDLYLRYWTEIRKAEQSKQKDVPEEKLKQNAEPKPPSIQVIRKWLHGNHHQEEVEVASYDDREGTSHNDFSSFSKDNLSEALQLSKLLVKKLSHSKGHRYIPAKQDKLLDLRKIMRQNIGRSDEMIYLHYKKKKIEKVKITLICDVSRSMELYARFLIQFMYSMNQAATKVETFVFSTHLARITKSLQIHDYAKVISALKNIVGWSGGTKIGESLWSFTQQFSGHVVDQKTKIIILSDGWDTGNPELVKQSMTILKRKASKIIWLNPLAGNPQFKAETACLKAALPYVDIFQAANSIKDLRMLIQAL